MSQAKRKSSGADHSIPERVTMALLRAGETQLAQIFAKTGMCVSHEFLDRVELALINHDLRDLQQKFAKYREALGVTERAYDGWIHHAAKDAWKEIAASAMRTRTRIGKPAEGVQ